MTSFLAVLYSQWSRLFVPIVLLFLGIVAADVFQESDRDGDGMLNRNEFSQYISHVKKSIDPFLEMPAADVGVATGDGSPLPQFFTKLVDGNNFVAAFINSFIMILVTEIGDKTFFIAAVLAMRNGRFVVYAGAMAALTAMHLLSSLMGYALPALLSRKYTNIASTVLFVYFGFRLLKDAMSMSPDGPSDELQEIENELIDKKDVDTAPPHDVEDGKVRDFENQRSRSRNIAVMTQALTMTFLAEWGDRSQIATIALAASKNTYGVIIGGLLGHALCTGVAVIGGRMLAAKISERTVSIIGGLGFFVFALHSFFFEDPGSR